MRSSSPLDAQYEVRVGGHLFRWEPPDIGYVSYLGDLQEPAAGEFSARSRRFTLGRPYVFLIVDMAKLGKISAEARKQSAQGSKDLNLRGVAVIGASASMRIVAGLVSRAIDLLNRNPDNPTRFFETEAEARAWIAARRIAIQKELERSIRP